MKDEQLKTIEGLKLAIQIEIGGKEFYEDAAEKSLNKAGKQLFEWLAAEEEKHRNRFEQIYDAITSKKSWPRMKLEVGANIKAKTIFSEFVTMSKDKVYGGGHEIDIINKAMDMENKTRILYEERSLQAKFEAEKKFYQALSEEEMGHYLALVDYREYIIDPSSFFTKWEHHSLDGG